MVNDQVPLTILSFPFSAVQGLSTPNMTISVLSYVLFAFLLLHTSFSSSTTTEEICSTRNGASSISSVPSTTYTKSTTSRVTVRSTTTPTNTITPIPSRTIVTVTSFSTLTLASTTDTITQTEYSEVYVTSTGETQASICVIIHICFGG